MVSFLRHIKYHLLFCRPIYFIVTLWQCRGSIATSQMSFPLMCIPLYCMFICCITINGGFKPSTFNSGNTTGIETIIPKC